MCFLKNGCLPPGIHEMDWDEFEGKFNFSPKRKVLLNGLKDALDVLKKCGCDKIYIDGSFVTSKLEPGDYDACWEGDFDYVFNKMLVDGPIFVDMKDLATGRNGQKKKYGGEILPAESIADTKGTKYIDFFQQIRGSDEKKGIIALKL